MALSNLRFCQPAMAVQDGEKLPGTPLITSIACAEATEAAACSAHCWLHVVNQGVSIAGQVIDLLRVLLAAFKEQLLE